MSTTIFIIKGTTGEYSDRRTWMVRAYPTEQQAIDFVTALAEKAHELGVHSHGASEWDDDDGVKLKAMQELDPNCDHIDYTGVRYFHQPVELYP